VEDRRILQRHTVCFCFRLPSFTSHGVPEVQPYQRNATCHCSTVTRAGRRSSFPPCLGIGKCWRCVWLLLMRPPSQHWIRSLLLAETARVVAACRGTTPNGPWLVWASAAVAAAAGSCEAVVAYAFTCIRPTHRHALREVLRRRSRWLGSGVLADANTRWRLE